MMRLKKPLLFILLLVPFGVRAQTPVRALSAAQVVEHVRQAIGYNELLKLEHGLIINGQAEYLELKGTFLWRYTSGGRLLHEIQGPIGMSLRFDGRKGWISNWAGLERQIEMEDLESVQTEFWVITNRWLAADGPFDIKLLNEQSNDREQSLSLHLKGGILEAQLTIDSASWLPVHFKYRTPGKTQTWRFEDYQRFSGIAIPRLVTETNEKLVNHYWVEKISKATDSSLALFSLTPKRLVDTEWNRETDTKVEIKRARTGHLLVKPTIDGRVVGWFMLDSGAGAMIITPEAAQLAEMKAFGKVPVRGVAGTVMTPFRRGKRFELGQLVIRNPLYLELDFKAISRAIGEEIAGICGYDLFLRSIVVLDAAVPALEIHDPERFVLEEGKWQEMLIDRNIPHIKCRFEGDREDVFRLDTGADNTVSFHSPAVEKYRLLDGRPTRLAPAGGIGGTIVLHRGKLSWFEIAGHRFLEPDVALSTATQGAFANAYVAGNVGGIFLRQFRIVFNYSQRTIALIEK